MRGHADTTAVCGLDHCPHLVDGERCRLLVRAVEVELDEIGAVVELAHRRGQKSFTIRHFRAQALGQDACARDPCACCAHIWVLATTGPAIPHSKRQGAFAAIDRVGSCGRTDVTRPAHARRPQEPRVVLSDLHQPLGWIEATLDPVRATRHGQVAVAVDQAGDDRAAGRVNHLGVAGIGLVIGRPDPRDPVPLDQHTDPHLRIRSGRVGQRRIAIENALHTL